MSTAGSWIITNSINIPLLAKYAGFFKKFNINYYIAVNVTYDEEKSQQSKNQLLRSISRTRGMIQEGQGIISKGEFINT